MMMKLTFEGKTLGDILDEMKGVLERFRPTRLEPVPVPEVTAPKGDAQLFNSPIVAKSVDKPVEKRARSEKQLANDEKMRVAALERVAAKRAAKAQAQGYATTLRKDLDRDPIEAKPVEKAPDPFTQEPEEVDPAEMVKIREKTFEELRTAYANGHQNEVMELLSRFGNGAKTFRELPPESFMPIRKAIDLGALE